MATKNKELLIQGFIREIQTILEQNTLIPLDIIQICYLFCSTPISLFYISKATSTIHILNGKSIYTLFFNKKNKDNAPVIQSACYIPDISSFIDIKNMSFPEEKRYDGIVAISSPNKNAMIFKSNIILFDNNINHNKTREYYSFLSDETVANTVGDLIYCDGIGAVMYCDWRGIHQMKLQDINLNNKTFPFKYLSQSGVTKKGNASLGYIHGKNSLFIIENMFKWKVFSKYLSFSKHITNTYTITSDRSQCGIFDLEEEKWTTIKPFIYNMYTTHYSCSLGICQNNKFDSNNVYIASNIGHAAKFDTHKQKWIMLIEDLQKDYTIKPVVWMDDTPFIINSSDYAYYRYFDVRDNKIQWIENCEMCTTANLFQVSAPNGTPYGRNVQTFFL